jgi:hypothetical protein
MYAYDSVSHVMYKHNQYTDSKLIVKGGVKPLNLNLKSEEPGSETSLSLHFFR